MQKIVNQPETEMSMDDREDVALQRLYNTTIYDPSFVLGVICCWITAFVAFLEVYNKENYISENAHVGFLVTGSALVAHNIFAHRDSLNIKPENRQMSTKSSERYYTLCHAV